jgi:uncharacterized membrane protein YkoI
MRLQITILAALLALFVALPVVPGGAALRAQDRCISWSEARSAGLIDKFKLRPASEIKSDIEKRHGGKVVSFQICQESDALIYSLAVYKANGDVLFVKEAAESAKPAEKSAN